MAVRNFWVEASIDGRRTELAGSPASKDGGMGVTIYQRKNGRIEEAVCVSCYMDDGRLISSVTIGGKYVGQFETER